MPYDKSLEKYLEMIQAGVAGPHEPNDLVTALQLISTHHFAGKKLYTSYTKAFNKQRGAKKIYEKICKVFQIKEVTYKLAETSDELTEILQNARQGGLRVLIYITASHIIGLRQEHTSNQWKLVGSWVPMHRNFRKKKDFPWITGVRKDALPPIKIFRYLHKGTVNWFTDSESNLINIILINQEEDE